MYTWEKARDYALRLLTYRERSRCEIGNKLKEKGYDQEIIKTVLTRLENSNLLNDRRFAQNWAISRLKRKYTSLRIFAELKKKGVEEEIIKQVLREAFSEVDEFDLALGLIHQKNLSLKNRNLQQMRRIAGMLQRRGFSFSTIRRVIDHLSRQDQES